MQVYRSFREVSGGRREKGDVLICVTTGGGWGRKGEGSF